jgi:hypothetical protein
LSTLIAGLIRNAGQHVTCKLPKNLEEAVLVVVAAFEVEAQKRNLFCKFRNAQ